MTLIVDAGPLIATADVEDPRRLAVQEIIRAEADRIVVPAPVTTEVDYLSAKRLGRATPRAFIADYAAGRYRVVSLEPEDYATVAELERRYESLSPGLADLSIVVLAHRHRTRRILTFDERHFRAMRPLQGGVFTLLPADS